MIKRMNKKNISINYIKAFASFSVTAVHFRNRTESLIIEDLITSKLKLFYSFNYSLFIVAVPLFILVTGYLSINSRPNSKYFIKILKTYLLYLFLATFSYYIMVYMGIRNSIGLLSMLKLAMKFELVSGWYIELYVGLAILAPFFNIMLSSLTKNQHQKFIIALLFCISLPAFTNSVPQISKYLYLPNFYSNMYPFVYYTIGNYFRKYDKELLSFKRYALLSITLMVSIAFIVFINASPYTSASDGYYGSIIQVILASSIFLMFRSLPNLKDSKIVDFISKYSLSTYVMSLPVDRILYPVFISIIGSPIQLIPFSPLIVLMAFLTALITGWILHKIFNFFWSLLKVDLLLDNFVERILN